MRYFANPAHKIETTEAGPPAWRPDKTPCPKGMTLRERTELLRDSIAEDPNSPISRRFAVRRSASGLDFFYCTDDTDCERRNRVSWLPDGLRSR